MPVAERLEIPASIVEQALTFELEAGEVVADTVGNAAASSWWGCIGQSEHSRSSQAASEGRTALASHRFGKGNPVGRGPSRHHARREPAGRAPACSALEGPGHHRRPWVGKTTLINSILKVLHAKGIEIALAAPTGRAAKRLSETGRAAKTIHRLLDIDPRRGSRRNQESPLRCDLLVVDETSMIDVPLMHAAASCA